MAEEPECQLRRRRSSGNPSLPLNLDVDCLIYEGGPGQGTPSPSHLRHIVQAKRLSSAAFEEFKKKQQSFDIQVEECEEEEIIIESDEEEPAENEEPSGINRAVTPTPIQDFGASVTYLEGPQTTDFLRVKTIEQECYTDVSDADTDDEADE